MGNDSVLKKNREKNTIQEKDKLESPWWLDN